MDTTTVQETLSNAFETVLAAVATALAAVVGGVLNAWITRRKQKEKDLIAAAAKIRAIQERIGLAPEEFETIDDAFCAIRRINAILDRNERAKNDG
jgi:hypothetical protein